MLQDIVVGVYICTLPPVSCIQDCGVAILFVSLPLNLALVLGPLDPVKHSDTCVRPDWSWNISQISVRPAWPHLHYTEYPRPAAALTTWNSWRVSCRNIGMLTYPSPHHTFFHTNLSLATQRHLHTHSTMSWFPVPASQLHLLMESLLYMAPSLPAKQQNPHHWPIWTAWKALLKSFTTLISPCKGLWRWAKQELF